MLLRGALGDSCTPANVPNFHTAGTGAESYSFDVFKTGHIKRKVHLMAKHDDDNHADQLNPNNDAYWESRGWDERPDDWDERINQDDPFVLFPPVVE